MPNCLSRAILIVLILMPLSAFSAIQMSTTTQCGFGIFSLCFWDRPAAESGSSLWRSEVFTGYKAGMRYYRAEEENCKASEGCRFRDSGAVFGADIYRNMSGNNRTTDFTDIGFQYSQIPVADWSSSNDFQGTLGRSINRGSGELRYHFLRVAIKRGQFLSFLHSKYLISSFGVGMGVPEARGTARDVVGAQNPVPSIGGKLGFQIPIHDSMDIGLATNWSVLWYGKSMGDSAFIAGYGLNLSLRI